MFEHETFALCKDMPPKKASSSKTVTPRKVVRASPPVAFLPDAAPASASSFEFKVPATHRQGRVAELVKTYDALAPVTPSRSHRPKVCLVLSR